MSTFSAASALDAVRAGTPVQSLADARSMEEILHQAADLARGWR